MIADVPASPFNLTVAHNTTESSNSKLLNTTLTWDFLSNGGYWRYTELYYNVSVYPSNGTTAQTHFLITSRREAPLVLSQNISYNISIVAVNCEGQSTKAEISFAFFPHSVKGKQYLDCRKFCNTNFSFSVFTCLAIHMRNYILKNYFSKEKKT